MRVLRDECLPRRIKRELPGHAVWTVPEAGWAGKSNGDLLALANDGGVDVFVTMDQSIIFQQDVSTLHFAVVVLRARSNRFDVIQPLMAEVRQVLETLAPGRIVRVPSGLS